MRKMRNIVLSLLAVTAVSGYASLHAALPTRINFQGQITNANGSPVTGTLTMTFNIYNSLAGSTILKTIPNVSVAFSENGLYAVELDLSGIDLNQSLWLGIALGSDEEMSPRASILPSAASIFSLTAGSAQDSSQLGGVAASLYLTKTGDGSSLTGLENSYAEMFSTNNAVNTGIGFAGTFVKVGNVTAAGELKDFTHTTGKLTYTGTKTKIFRCIVSLDASSTIAVNQAIEFLVYKNGSEPISKSHSKAVIAALTDRQSFTLSCLVSLATNDYLELFVTNTLATNAVKVEDLNFNLVEIK